MSSIKALLDLLKNEVCSNSIFFEEDINLLMLLYYLKIVFQLDNLFNNVLPISAGDFAIVIPHSFILFILS